MHDVIGERETADYIVFVHQVHQERDQRVA